MSEIFIGYKRFLGIIDIKNIYEYLKVHTPEKIIIVISKNPSKTVEDFYNEIIKPIMEIDFVYHPLPYKKAKEIKKQFKKKKVKLQDLEDFGLRNLYRDFC
ncbi:MAG: hypothetical protein H0Z24_09855 [Thermosipho sp. (in: Bacteria)]|nr:hypothetical protein [Thermosipho sp. (in: thermotogales)]